MADMAARMAYMAASRIISMLFRWLVRQSTQLSQHGCSQFLDGQQVMPSTTLSGAGAYPAFLIPMPTKLARKPINAITTNRISSYDS